MSSPSVSVIIPVYNTAEFLREALDSVLDQTLKDIEIIAVNDGSTDGCAAILDEYSDRVTVITKQNAGQAAARNDALRIARGEFIFFMDSDDMIRPETLERCLDLCVRDNLDFAFFDATSFGAESTGVGWQDYHRAAYYPGVLSGPETMARMLADGRYRCSVCMSVFRACFIKGIEFHSGIIHEDELYSARVYFKAQRIEGIPEEFYLRRLRTDSTMTRRFSKRNVDGYLTVVREAPGYALTPSSKKACRALVSSIFLSLMHNGWCLPFGQKMRIVGSLAAHPYAFRFKPFCVLLLKH